MRPVETAVGRRVEVAMGMREMGIVSSCRLWEIEQRRSKRNGDERTWSGRREQGVLTDSD